MRKLIITKTFKARSADNPTSVCLPAEMVEPIRKIAKDTGRTLQDVTGTLLEFALEYAEVSTGASQ